MHAARALGAVLATVLLAPAASADQRDVLDVRERSSSAVALADLAPGDSSEWAAEVTNTDSTGHALAVGFDSDGALLTDEDGLRLAVDLCDSPFDAVPQVTPEGRTVERFTCASGDVPLGSGPASALGRLETARPIAEGSTVGVRVRVAFPESAGNALENAAGSLRVVFSVAGTGSGAPIDDPVPGPAPASPGMPVGSLAVTMPAAQSEIRAGDVVVFTDPTASSRRVIHRVTSVYSEEEAAQLRDHDAGELALTTKGDNNAAADPWILTIADDRVWREEAVVPLLGWPGIALTTPEARFALFAAGGALVVTAVLVVIWRRPSASGSPARAGTADPEPARAEAAS
ncbi:hypothetical protein NB037_16895 [Rathayibacter sp. ZW T2_19]|uniref:Signal peptidase I n=1 Tax=Rathayibacter rubneri TaxID=2950106 RepID=A0A9X2E0I6_9MICO|nr:hypothetical protein [Rathayibacter rubneri]MCM6764093.1 hypothetical protein [Rathayibacter rubneri]